MAFDLKTAKLENINKFDLNTAKPEEQEVKKSFGKAILGVLPPVILSNLIRATTAKTPEEGMRISKEGLSQIESGRSEILGPIAKHFSTRAAGIPEVLLKAINPEAANFVFPKSETFLGKTAEFGGEVSGIMKGIVGKSAGVAKNLAPKGLKTLTEGATMGGILSPENPKDFFNPKERAGQAAGGAIGAAVGAGAIKGFSVLGRISQSGSRKMIESLIKINKGSISYGKDPARGIIKEKIIAKSFDDLEKKVEQKMNFRFKKITEKLNTKKNLEKRLNVSNALTPIDDAIAKASESPRTNASVIKQLQDIKLDLLGAQLDNTGNITYTKNLTEISPLEATKLKRQIADITKFTGNPSDDKIVNNALKKVYGKVKNEINNVIPGLKEDNERLADLISADTLIKHRSVIVKRQNIIDLPSTVVGTGIGLGTGNPLLPLITIPALSASKKALSSTALKTSSAQFLDTLSALKSASKFNNIAISTGAAIGSRQ